MSKTEVLVDTVFFNKLSNEGKNVDDFKTVLDRLEYKPIVHPYVADNELDVYGYFERLRTEGYARVADYSEFLKDEADRTLYEFYFIDLYDKLRIALEKKGGKKQIGKLVIPENQTVFTMRKSGMSLGDVHMILMALFMKIPIMLTDDSDLGLLRELAKKHFNSDEYKLEIFNTSDVLMKVAVLEETTISKALLIDILNRVGGRSRRSELKSIWNANHML